MAAMQNKMVAAVSIFFMSYLRPSCRNEPLCCWCGLYGVCPISGNNINRFFFDYKRGKEKTKDGICIATMISQLKTHLRTASQRSVGEANPTSFFSVQSPEAGDGSGEKRCFSSNSFDFACERIYIIQNLWSSMAEPARFPSKSLSAGKFRREVLLFPEPRPDSAAPEMRLCSMKPHSNEST